MAERDSDASWKGKAIEQLVAAWCVLGSDGRLNASIPMVDDSGVDLLFSLRDSPITLAVQVKSRFRSSKRVQGGSFRIQVRQETFVPRPSLALLAVLYDDYTGRGEIETAWFIPSIDFARLTVSQHRTQHALVMVASLAGHGNMWLPYRCNWAELPRNVEKMLDELASGL